MTDTDNNRLREEKRESLEDIFRDHGVTDDEIDWLAERVDETAREMFDDYDVEPDNPDRAVDVLIVETFQTVHDHAQELDVGMAENFRRIMDDFESDSSARSDIAFMAGRCRENDQAILYLANALMAANYNRD